MKFHELHITPNNSLQKALNHSEWHSKLRPTTRWQRVFQLACIHVQSKSQINQQVGIVLQWRLWWQIEGTGRGRHLSFNIQGVQVSTLPENNLFAPEKQKNWAWKMSFLLGPGLLLGAMLVFGSVDVFLWRTHICSPYSSHDVFQQIKPCNFHPFKCPYKWWTRVITLLIEAFTPFIYNR